VRRLTYAAKLEDVDSNLVWISAYQMAFSANAT